MYLLSWPVLHPVVRGAFRHHPEFAVRGLGVLRKLHVTIEKEDIRPGDVVQIARHGAALIRAPLVPQDGHGGGGGRGGCWIVNISDEKAFGPLPRSDERNRFARGGERGRQVAHTGVYVERRRRPIKAIEHLAQVVRIVNILNPRWIDEIAPVHVAQIGGVGKGFLVQKGQVQARSFPRWVDGAMEVRFLRECSPVKIARRASD